MSIGFKEYKLVWYPVESLLIVYISAAIKGWISRMNINTVIFISRVEHQDGDQIQDQEYRHKAILSLS
jgi:hypothetical protein